MIQLPQLPPAFLQSLHGLPGFEEPAFVQAHQAAEQLTSIRLNSAKPTAVFPNKQAIPWCSTGYYLPQRPSFTLDPLFHAGAYYVQEASSMFLEQALRQTIDLSKPLNVLDLCAAPGGKSTHLQSLLSKDSLLVSNEVIKARASVLTENMTKWGAANGVVTNNDPAHFQRLPSFFDVLVVDAPCSGSGLFRKDPDAITEWSEAAVQLCSQRQQRILADALPCLKGDGILIYSTCSYSEEEDEGILQWLMHHSELESLRLQTELEWNIIETDAAGAYSYRFYPDKVKGEGFFIGVFRKKRTSENGVTHLPKAKATTAEKEASRVLQPWLQGEMNFVAEKDDWLAMPATVAAQLAVLKKQLYLRKAGINMGRLIRQCLVPHHELALAAEIAGAVDRITVTEAQALQYLRRQEITDLQAGSNGWQLVEYGGLALGWIKVIGHRTNNYYPTEWRILK